MMINKELLYLILLILIGGLLPIWSVFVGPRIRKELITDPNKKLDFYQQTILFLIVMTLIVLGAMWLNNEQLDVIGLSFINQSLWTTSLYLLVFVTWWVFQKITLKPEKIDGLLKQFDEVKFILPTTHIQYQWTTALSCVAGVCEEVVYRGFIFWQLDQLMHWSIALLLTNLSFALSHYGSKIKNMTSAFGLGLIFSGAYLLTGSLWLPIFLHIAVDFYSSTMASKLYINPIVHDN